MSNEDRKGEGTAEKIGGKIKEGVGKLTGNEQLEAEGKAQALRGEARREAAKAGERAKGTAEQVAGKIKNRVGAFTGDRQQQVEGKAKELEGEARVSHNRSSSPSLL